MLVDIGQRISNDVTVAVLWDDATGKTYVELENDAEWYREEIPANRVNDALLHPYTYLPRFSGEVKIPGRYSLKS